MSGVTGAFKPMKGDDADLSKAVFPYMLSPKLDGHRCVVMDGVALTSSLKPFPNEHVQRSLGHAYNGLDGELIVGSATDSDVFLETTRGVRRVSGEPDFKFHVFDRYDAPQHAMARYELARAKARELPFAVVVPMDVVHSIDEIEAMEEKYLAEGYEGVMLRHPDSPYKLGRSTVRQNYLLKVKRFADHEAEIIGFVEQRKNTNEKVTNALGRGQRSSAKAGKVGKWTMGALTVRGLNGPFAGVEFEVGTGYDDALRKSIWNDPAGYLGKAITYKHQPVGNYAKPRIPIFKAFRPMSEVDIALPKE